MSTLVKRILVIVWLALAFCGTSSAEEELQKGDHACFGKLAKPLAEGGYSAGSVYDCSDVTLKIKKVGDIAVKGRKFSIYFLRYKTIPKSWGVAHGGQRILVFENDKSYIGQYSGFLANHVYIRGTSVYLDVPKEYGDHISFEGGGPPAQAHVDGYVVDLYK
jgi:hypothetical protein